MVPHSVWLLSCLIWKGPNRSTPQYVKGGADVTLSSGRSAIFCSAVVPRRRRHTTQLEMRCLTAEFALTIQYRLLCWFNVMPLPAWAIFLWVSWMIRSTMKLFFGRITEWLKSSANSCELPSLPPTRMSPSLSWNGSRRKKDTRLLNFSLLRLRELPIVLKICSLNLL